MLEFNYHREWRIFPKRKPHTVLNRIIMVLLTIACIIAVIYVLANASDMPTNDDDDGWNKATLRYICYGEKGKYTQLTTAAKDDLDSFWEMHQSNGQYAGYSAHATGMNGTITFKDSEGDVLQVWNYVMNAEGLIDSIENIEFN